jgi:hypothetical protein
MIVTLELSEPPRVPLCAACHCPMHLARIEWEMERVDRYTFDCKTCAASETRSFTCQ